MSVVVALAITAVCVMLTSVSGKALVRFRGCWMAVALIFGTPTLPCSVVVIPQVITVARDMAHSNTRFVLIVPPLSDLPGVLFTRQNLAMWPADLFDAA